ncbi:MAG: tRNA 2-thiouridine(34) synthase MnmA [Myxococcota bacterium]|nr:tRNA 2-thiouridine(34) synthase MnmA [Myxococcota bacterium]
MKVVVAMSGGVDSSVTAALMREAGHEVIGVHMKLHDAPAVSDGKHCCGLDDVLDARRVAERMNFPFYVMDLQREFKKAVMDYFADTYIRGATPNPCIQCNGVLKFSVLLQRAAALGAEALATGHYARVLPGGGLAMAVDANKDQSYFLFPVRRSALQKTLFPLGEMTKAEVREHGRRLGLINANKPESQEVCFIPDDNHTRFVRQHRPDADGAGEIVDESGAVLGKHDGYWRYTIGQRRGLGVSSSTPLYVLSVDATSRRVTVGPHERLFQQGLEAYGVNWFRKPAPDEDIRCRLRHRGALHPCAILSEDPLTIRLTAPARAIAPGQAAVLYVGDEVVGGGWIRRVLD